jgi:hypothetical protein
MLRRFTCPCCNKQFTINDKDIDRVLDDSNRIKKELDTMKVLSDNNNILSKFKNIFGGAK